MNRVVRSGLALSLGFGLTMAAIKVADRDEPAATPPGTELGGVDFSAYCRRAHGSSATAQLDETQGAYGWRCWTTANDIITFRDIDLQEVCELAYGEPAYEQTANINDPHGWRCFRGPRLD